MAETELNKPDSKNITPKDPDRVKIDPIFTDTDIQELWQSKNPIVDAAELIENYIRKKTGNIDIDPQLLLATAEFHVNNLIFLKEKFSLTWNALAKMLNLLAVMLNLNDGERSEDIRIVDFDTIIKSKLKDIKRGLLQQGLIFTGDTRNGEAIKPAETLVILDYLNNTFFNFIQLYYFFENIERKVDNEILEVIINKPIKTPSLSQATKIEKPKEQVEEKKEEKKEVTNFID